MAYKSRVRSPAAILFGAFLTLQLFAQPSFNQQCNYQSVIHSGNTWTVLPTGSDDTNNLQCAFDQATRMHHSNVVLVSGTYHTGQVAISGFVGSFRGAGSDRTIIKTLDRTLKVAPDNFFVHPPTPEDGSNPWPSIFAFLGGDIVISDFSLVFTDNVWTTGWTWTGLGVTVYELAHGIVIVGPVVPGKNYTEANAAVYRIEIDGVPRGVLAGLQPLNGVFYEGFFGAPFGQTLPLRGRFTVSASQFSKVAGGAPVYNLYDSEVSITNNRSVDSLEGTDVGGLTQTIYEYANNSVTGSTSWGLNLYGPSASSRLLISNNLFTGNGYGLFFDDSVTFSGNMSCELLQNNVEKVNGTGIYLGPGVSGCLVVCNSYNDTVVDKGVDNHLVGCPVSMANRGTKPSVPSPISQIR